MRYEIAILSMCSALLAGSPNALQAKDSRDLYDPAKQKATASTNLDFDSSLIDGKHKAPMGFLLQGRNRQSLSNMVQLRTEFKDQLRRSRAAIRALVR